MSVRLTIATALALGLLVTAPGNAQLGSLKDLPNVGDQKGPWIASDKSMPYLLAQKYTIVNISEQPHGTPIPYLGFSYYIQKLSDLYRCDETGEGNEYVVCWYFQPKNIKDAKITNKLIGSWMSVDPETPDNWQFSLETINGFELNNKEFPCIFDVRAHAIKVTVLDRTGTYTIEFTIVSDNEITFNSNWYHKDITLKRM